MTGQLVPVTPTVHGMAPSLELAHGGLGETAFQVEQVARLADRPPTGEEARQLEGRLDVQAEVDHPDVRLQLDLRLSVGAHAAQHAPELALALAHGRDEGVKGDL